MKKDSSNMTDWKTIAPLMESLEIEFWAEKGWKIFVKSQPNVDCIFHMSNGEPIVHDLMVKQMNYVLAALLVQGHYIAREQYLVHSFCYQSLQALLFRELKLTDEHWHINLATVAPNHLLASNALEVCCRLSMWLKHTEKKFLQVEIFELKTAVELRAGEQVDEDGEEVMVDVNRNGVDVQRMELMKEKQKKWEKKMTERWERKIYGCLWKKWVKSAGKEMASDIEKIHGAEYRT